MFQALVDRVHVVLGSIIYVRSGEPGHLCSCLSGVSCLQRVGVLSRSELYLFRDGYRHGLVLRILRASPVSASGGLLSAFFSSGLSPLRIFFHFYL